MFTRNSKIHQWGVVAGTRSGGLGTQLVLRHADVSTTMAYYVKPSQEAAKRGLKKLSDAVQKKYKIRF